MSTKFCFIHIYTGISSVQFCFCLVGSFACSTEPNLLMKIMLWIPWLHFHVPTLCLLFQFLVLSSKLPFTLFHISFTNSLLRSVVKAKEPSIASYKIFFQYWIHHDHRGSLSLLCFLTDKTQGWIIHFLLHSFLLSSLSFLSFFPLYVKITTTIQLPLGFLRIK